MVGKKGGGGRAAEQKDGKAAGRLGRLGVQPVVLLARRGVQPDVLLDDEAYCRSCGRPSSLNRKRRLGVGGKRVQGGRGGRGEGKGAGPPAKPGAPPSSAQWRGAGGGGGQLGTGQWVEHRVGCCCCMGLKVVVHGRRRPRERRRLCGGKVGQRRGTVTNGRRSPANCLASTPCAVGCVWTHSQPGDGPPPPCHLRFAVCMMEAGGEGEQAPGGVAGTAHKEERRPWEDPGAAQGLSPRDAAGCQRWAPGIIFPGTQHYPAGIPG